MGQDAELWFVKIPWDTFAVEISSEWGPKTIKHYHITLETIKCNGISHYNIKLNNYIESKQINVILMQKTF